MSSNKLTKEQKLINQRQSKRKYLKKKYHEDAEFREKYLLRNYRNECHRRLNKYIQKGGTELEFDMKELERVMKSVKKFILYYSLKKSDIIKNNIEEINNDDINEINDDDIKEIENLTDEEEIKKYLSRVENEEHCDDYLTEEEIDYLSDENDFIM